MPVSTIKKIIGDEVNKALKGILGGANEGGFGPHSSISQYSFDSMTYPIDLFDPTGKYGRNYVVFFVNVLEDSKLLKEGEKFANGLDLNGGRGSAVAMANSMTQGQNVAVGGVVTGIVGGVLGKLFGGGGSALPAAAKAIGIGSGATAIAGSKVGGFGRPVKRLTTAIAMHLPNDIQISYGARWDEDDTFLFAGAQSAVKEVSKAMESGKSKGLVDLAGDVVTANSTSISGGLSNVTGQSKNPKKEQIFKGVDHRTFQISYMFHPRSAAESKSVQNIITMFKYHMMPELTGSNDNGLLYLYPSEFDIEYYKGDGENRNFHKHTSCVLTNMSVNYTPNGVATTFEDGSPTQININLQFKELKILTKEDIAKGY